MVACRSVGDDMTIRGVHISPPVRAPMPACLVFRYIVTDARCSASRWFMSSGRRASSTSGASTAASNSVVRVYAPPHSLNTTSGTSAKTPESPTYAEFGVSA